MAAILSRVARVVRSRTIRYVALAVSLAIGFYALLYVTTEEWRVYAGGAVPSFEWLLLYDHSGWLTVLAWLVPLTLFCVGIVSLTRRWKWMWLGLLLLIPAFFVARHYVICFRQWDSIVSCANHANFWMHIHIDPGTPLPESTEFADLLAADSDFLPMDVDGDRDLTGMQCPGYRRAGTKTGVVFVGGGLRLDSLECGSILIAFCSWPSHLPPYDRQHCLTAGPEGYFYREPVDTETMIVVIETALRRAAEGTVPYSEAAQEVLRFELAKRKELLGVAEPEASRSTR